jgi:hypothetical protein
MAAQGQQIPNTNVQVVIGVEEERSEKFKLIPLKEYKVSLCLLIRVRVASCCCDVPWVRVVVWVCWHC